MPVSQQRRGHRERSECVKFAESAEGMAAPIPRRAR